MRICNAKDDDEGVPPNTRYTNTTGERASSEGERDLDERIKKVEASVTTRRLFGTGFACPQRLEVSDNGTSEIKAIESFCPPCPWCP